jgi:hypothetical protein
MSTTQKLLNLAFHPSTNESEAINAFLALRRADDIQDFVQGESLTDSKNFETIVTYTATVPSKSYDLFVYSLNEFNDNFSPEEPCYRLKSTKERKYTYEAYSLEVKIFLKKDSEQPIVDAWMKGVFEILKKYNV